MRQVEGNSDNTAENFSLKVKKTFHSKSKKVSLNVQKNRKNYWFSQKNSPKWSSGHVECSFDDLSNIFY